MTAFESEYQKRLADWSDIQGHLPFLHEQACKSKVILELGVRSGVSTSALLAGAEKHGGHVWSVDIDPPDVPTWWLKRTDLWTFIQGDDLDVTTVRHIPSMIDLLFIDTTHFYDQTRAELLLYVPRVRHGGIVCCHDTELEAAPGHPEGYVSFSVSRALETFCQATGHKWENRTGSHGLGVIRI